LATGEGFSVPVFPTLVGVVRLRCSLVAYRYWVFPTLVGVVRPGIPHPRSANDVFPTLVGVVRCPPW